MDIFKKIKNTFGSQSELARRLGIKTPMTVSQWKTRGQIPAAWCIPIAEASEGKITLHELRPDLYVDQSQVA